MSQSPIWVNGETANTLPIADRGLQYGDGLFETMRVSNKRITLADYHWTRLSRSCKRLSIRLDILQLQQEAAKFLHHYNVDNAVLKVIITRGSGGRGYSPHGCEQPTRVLALYPLPVRNPDPAIHGAKIRLCKHRLGYSALAGIKHLNRLDQVIARREWQSEFDEGILCDDQGNFVEGTMSNLFTVTHDGTVITPPIERCGVNGVCRQWILANATKWGIIALEQPISTTLAVAELFLCNSINGVWPVISFQGIATDRKVWNIGSTTQLIQRLVMESLND